MPRLPENQAPAPTDNLILAALPAGELEQLLPHLKPVVLSRGQVLHKEDEAPNSIYFLTQGVVCLTLSTQDNKDLNLSLIGREGIVGERAIFEGGLLQMRCTLLTAGHAYRMAPSFFNEEFQGGGKLHDLVMRSLEARMLETSQTALCCQMHPLEQRLSRWLLTFADRLGSDTLRLTHDTIAQMLGTRRQGVTGAVRALTDAGLISHSRGFITITHRKELERQTCECYEVMKRGVERAYHLKRTMKQSGTP